MEYWDQAPLRRDQTFLFTPTLEDAVSDDHPVRLLEELLQKQDWSEWKAEYDGTRGRPPIPPWVMAGVILYGLMRGVRSSRMLEYLCTHNIDYLWLVEGRTIDHSTISKFRTRFRTPLKALFRQIGKLALRMGLVQLLEVALDGTRVKANASRSQTWTVGRLKAALQELDALFEAAMAETEQADAAQGGGAGEEKPSSAAADVATKKARQAKYRELLERLQAAEETRRKAGINPQKNPAQLPKADVDSKVMPNKEGGNAPNYTPLAATDAHQGIILDCEVVAEPCEHPQTLPTVDRIEETFGRKPKACMADSAHATGDNLSGMEQRQVEFYSPVESSLPGEGNPAKRDDPRQAVPEAEWTKLPRNDKKKLAKSCFIYDEKADCYYCPQGHVLNYEETKKEQRSGATVEMRVYRCQSCAGCPLGDLCREAKAKRGRSIRRDQYEPLRERMASKMASAKGKATYARRMHAAETPFAYIKSVMGVRQFLLRGLEKVRMEWLWVCTAYNLRKLLAHMEALRAALRAKVSETTS